MRWLTSLYDFRFKGTATAGIGLHPTKGWLSQLVNFKMQSGPEDTLEEGYAIKLCFKLGKNAPETYGMLQTAFRLSCRNRASVFEWHKRFKEGRESMRDDERCERSKEYIFLHSFCLPNTFLITPFLLNLFTPLSFKRPPAVSLEKSPDERVLVEFITKYSFFSSRLSFTSPYYIWIL